MAGEAGATFIALNASEFVEMFVGVGASRVRDLFAQVSNAAQILCFRPLLVALPASRLGISGCGHLMRLRPGCTDRAPCHALWQTAVYLLGFVRPCLACFPRHAPIHTLPVA